MQSLLPMLGLSGHVQSLTEPSCYHAFARARGPVELMGFEIILFFFVKEKTEENLKTPENQQMLCGE